MLTRHAVPAGDSSRPAWSWQTTADWADPTPLSLTLLEQVGEETPPTGAAWSVFAAVAARLASGWQPQPADLVRLDPGALAASAACVLVPAEATPELVLAPGTLALVGLTADETTAVDQVGVFRVLTLLGRSQHAFPCAPWIERGRASVTAAIDLAGSVLSKLHRIPAPGWSCTGGGGRTLLRIHPESPRAARAAIKQAAKAPLCFLLDPAWEAPAHFCWPPDPDGALHPHTARAKGSASAAFLIVRLTTGRTDQVTAVEDGIQLAVTTRNLGKITEALEGHESLDLPLPDMSKFCLRWTGVRAPQSRAPEAGSAEPDLPPPRPDVTLPNPNFTPAANWQTFTAALPGKPPAARPPG